ncbi:MAG: hypothetical protein U0703_00355 [Anaerolineae bacterium]
MRAKLILAVLIAGLALAQAALAKGPPQKITISGGDLPHEIEITDDEATLNALAMMVLEDYTTLTPDAPEGISGDGYLITRFYEQSPRRYVAFDEVRYYPQPRRRQGLSELPGHRQRVVGIRRQVVPPQRGGRSRAASSDRRGGARDGGCAVGDTEHLPARDGGAR